MVQINERSFSQSVTLQVQRMASYLFSKTYFLKQKTVICVLDSQMSSNWTYTFGYKSAFYSVY
jgi:hypothetical protein